MIEVRLSPEAEADKERLPTQMKYRLDDVLERLESWSKVSGVKWLKHEWTGHARIRMGDWRVIFRIENDVWWFASSTAAKCTRSRRTS